MKKQDESYLDDLLNAFSEDTVPDRRLTARKKSKPKAAPPTPAPEEESPLVAETAPPLTEPYQPPPLEEAAEVEPPQLEGEREDETATPADDTEKVEVTELPETFAETEIVEAPAELEVPENIEIPEVAESAMKNETENEAELLEIPEVSMEPELSEIVSELPEAMPELSELPETMPELELPEMPETMPELETPELEMPELSEAISDLEIPEMPETIPELETPELEMPELSEAISELEIPEMPETIPELPEMPETMPELEMPEISETIPEIEIPELDSDEAIEAALGTEPVEDLDLPEKIEFPEISDLDLSEEIEKASEGIATEVVEAVSEQTADSQEQEPLSEASGTEETAAPETAVSGDSSDKEEPVEEAAGTEESIAETTADPIQFGEDLGIEETEATDSPFEMLELMPEAAEEEPAGAEAAAAKAEEEPESEVEVDLEAISKPAKEKKAKKKKPKEPKEKKAGFFQKLFGNVPVEEKEKKDLPEGMTEEEAAAAKKAEKEAKAAQAAEQKAAKKAEKEAAKKEKAAKQKEKKDAAKKEKDAAKQQKKEAKAAQEPEDTGRINRVGATIVFVFFALVAVIILFGSESSAYVISIEDAKLEFSLQHYNKAYDKIRGLEIKKEDTEIRDKVMTVMYVNKQLNSYNNYVTLKDYPRALDSLLSGLKRYEKYSALADELGIKSDLDYVRGQMLAELERVYGIKEREAINLTEIKDSVEYTTRIYKLAENVQEEREEVEYLP